MSWKASERQRASAKGCSHMPSIYNTPEREEPWLSWLNRMADWLDSKLTGFDPPPEVVIRNAPGKGDCMASMKKLPIFTRPV